MTNLFRLRYGLALLVFCLATASAHADIGLVIEGPTGGMGFLSDVGHSAVWISRGCLDDHGTVYFCEGSPGVILSATSHWAQPGTAAIPADLYFLGTEARPETNPRAAWNDTLAATYPTVSPEDGQKYLGRVWGRATRVVTIPTTLEQDRTAIAQLQAQRAVFRYSTTKNNCADYTVAVLRLWLGDRLHARRWTDAWISTPRGVERGLVDSFGKEPRGDLRTYVFPRPRHWKANRPARDICEAGLLDPKYAVALIFLQPEAYVGMGGCYGYTRIRTKVQSRHHKVTGDDIAPTVTASSVQQVFARLTTSDEASTNSGGIE